MKKLPVSPIGGPVSGGVLTGIQLSEIDEIKSDSDRYDSAFYRGLDDPDSGEGGDGQ